MPDENTNGTGTEEAGAAEGAEGASESASEGASAGEFDSLDYFDDEVEVPAEALAPGGSEGEGAAPSEMEGESDDSTQKQGEDEKSSDAEGEKEDSSEEKKAREDEGSQKKTEPKKKEEEEPSAADSEAASPDSEKPQKNLMEQLQEHRDSIIGELAEKHFALSQAEEEALEADALTAVPKLLARVYYEAQLATIKHIENFVPKMIQSHLDAVDQGKSSSQKFYAQFPDLKPEEHGNSVKEFASAFKGMNPKITQDELFSLVGAAVMAKFGLSKSNGTGGEGEKVVEKEPPFTPAKAGGAAKPPKPEPESPFSVLNYDDDLE